MATKVRNQTEAKAWEATATRQMVAVDNAPNLFLIVQPAPSGKKSWAWRARRKGETIATKVTLGSFESYTLKDAIAWAAERTKDRDAGLDTKEALEATKAAQDAKDAAAAAKAEKSMEWFWRTHYRPRFVDTLKDSRGEVWYWDKRVGPAMGAKAVVDVTKADLSRIVNATLETAPTTANKIVGFLRTMFRRIMEHYGDDLGMAANPAGYLAKPHNEKRTRKQHVMQAHELGYLLRVIDARGDAKDFVSVYARSLKLVIHTGVRISEALEAPWTEFDLEAGTWTIDGTRTKNGFPHLLPLADETVAFLKAHREAFKGPYLFSTDPGGEAPMTLGGKAVDRLVGLTRMRAERDGLDMEKWSPHSIRRTFSTELNSITDNDLNPLIPVHVVEALLNHVSGSAKAGVAGIYNKYQYRKEKAEALRVWQRHLRKLARAEENREGIAKADERIKAHFEGEALAA